MILIIIGALVGLIIGWHISKHDKEPLYLIGMSIGVSVLIGTFISIMVGTCMPKEYVVVKEVEIVSMKNINSIQGRFILGTGGLETESDYIYWKKEGDGIKLDKIPVKKTIIYEEEDRSDGLIKVIEEEFKEENYCLFGTIMSTNRRYEVFVPKGSIVYDIRLEPN